MFTVKMVKTPDQMRNMVEGWIKITGIKYRDTTTEMQKRNPDVQWQFFMGSSIHITKIKSRDDRVFIHSAIGFADDIITGIQKLDNQRTAELVNGVVETIAISGLTWQWIVKDGVLTGIDIKSYVDEEELDRPTLFKTWDNISSIGSIVVNRIIMYVNPAGVKTTDVGKASDKQMYT